MWQSTLNPAFRSGTLSLRYVVTTDYNAHFTTRSLAKRTRIFHKPKTICVMKWTEVCVRVPLRATFLLDESKSDHRPRTSRQHTRHCSRTRSINKPRYIYFCGFSIENDYFTLLITFKLFWIFYKDLPVKTVNNYFNTKISICRRTANSNAEKIAVYYSAAVWYTITASSQTLNHNQDQRQPQT